MVTQCACVLFQEFGAGRNKRKKPSYNRHARLTVYGALPNFRTTFTPPAREGTFLLVVGDVAF